MKLTIVTPTHNTKYIKEVYDSLLAQTDKDWTWLIILNGDAQHIDIGDSRVKQIPYPNAPVSIGAVKNFAFSQVKEGICVELDHDDLLTPNAVLRIKQAFEDPKIGFVYSDFAEFEDGSWKPATYGSQYGWRFREKYFYGHKFHAMIAFEPSPHCIGSIHFAPNHVRAWTVEAYKKAGEHNPNFRVLDDQDIISRTYLTTRMKRIPECLYLYRNYPEQSFRRFNREIQSGTLKLYDKYIFNMAKRWCQLNNYSMVDLGAKHGKPVGFIGVDLYGTDIIADLNKKWPFRNSSVGLIRANDIIEHLKDPVNTMNEAYRILVDGGWLLIEVPSTDGRGAYQDPSHISRWNSNSFWYYTDRRYAKYVPAIRCRFQIQRILNYNPTKFHKQNYICYTRAHLTAIKNKRYPGAIKI